MNNGRLILAISLLSGAIISVISWRAFTHINQPQIGVPPAPTYFAQIDDTGTVVNVIVASQEFIDSGAAGDPSQWVQTYKDGSKRKNYAGFGYQYDKQRDAFIPPKPSDDAAFNPASAKWERPVSALAPTTTPL